MVKLRPLILIVFGAVTDVEGPPREAVSETRQGNSQKDQRDDPRRFCLLEMIEMLRTADGGELMRRLLGGMFQAVVDAEATGHIGAGVHQRTDDRTRPTATAPGHDCGQQRCAQATHSLLKDKNTWGL